MTPQTTYRRLPFAVDEHGYGVTPVDERMRQTMLAAIDAKTERERRARRVTSAPTLIESTSSFRARVVAPALARGTAAIERYCFSRKPARTAPQPFAALKDDLKAAHHLSEVDAIKKAQAQRPDLALDYARGTGLLLARELDAEKPASAPVGHGDALRARAENRARETGQSFALAVREEARQDLAAVNEYRSRMDSGERTR